jgi:hypothetical protein
VAAAGALAAVGQSHGLIMVDIGDPAHPRRLGSLGVPVPMENSGALSHVLAMSPSRAYLTYASDTHTRLGAVDVTDPAKPTLAAYRGGLVGLAPVGQAVLLLENSYGIARCWSRLLALKATDLEPIDSDDLGGDQCGWALAASGRRALVQIGDQTRTDDRIVVVDVDAAGGLSVVATHPAAGLLRDGLGSLHGVDGPIAWFVEDSADLRPVDFSNPGAPRPMQALARPEACDLTFAGHFDIAVAGGWLTLACADTGARTLLAYDARDAAAPAALGSWSRPSYEVYDAAATSRRSMPPPRSPRPPS